MLTKPLRFLGAIFLASLPIIVLLLGIFIASNIYGTVYSQLDFVLYSLIVIISCLLIIKLLLSFRSFKKVMTYFDTNDRYSLIVKNLYDNICNDIVANEKIQTLLNDGEIERSQKSLFNEKDFTEENNRIISFFIVWRIAQFAKYLKGIPSWTDFKTGLLIELYKSESIERGKILAKLINKDKNYFLKTSNMVEYFNLKLFMNHSLSKENQEILRIKIDKIIKKEASNLLYNHTEI